MMIHHAMEQTQISRLAIDKLRSILNNFFPKIQYCDIFSSDVPHVFIIKSSNDPDLIFKVHNPLIKERLYVLENIYKKCSKKGICPRFILSRKNQALTRYENYFISLQERIIPTDTIESISAKNLGRCLAMIHNQLALIQTKVKMKNHLYKEDQEMKDLASKYGYGYAVQEIEKTRHIVSQTQTQLIHGDLHKGNFLLRENKIYVLDFDSSTNFIPLSDLTFSLFRFFNLKKEKIEACFKSYNEISKNKIQPDQDHLRSVLIYNILQRILFILKENDGGNAQWLSDLENQKTYLRAVLNY